MWYNPMMTWLLRSPVHGLISKNFMLITLTGRKSGKTLTTPVNYVRCGNTLTVVSYRQRTWWRNLRGGASVTVRIQGQNRQALGRAYEDEERVAALLFEHLRNAPQYAKYFQVSLGPGGEPNREEVARAARERVMVQIEFV